MENSEREQSVTFGEIVRAIRKKIIVILSVTVAATALLVLLVGFLYNPNARTYSLDFEISYPGSDTLKYPDGTPFNYFDLISEDALEVAKASNDSFGKLDIRKLIAGDDISVSAIQSETGENRNTGWYKVTVKGSYFTGRQQATVFLRAVAQYAVSEAKRIAGEINYRLGSELFESADYSDRLGLLSMQKETLLAQYDEWISLYSESYRVLGKTLRNYRAETAVMFNDSTLAAYKNELSVYGYTPLKDVESRVRELQAEKRANEAKLAALRKELSAAQPTALGQEQSEVRPTALRQETGAETGNVALDISEQIAALVVRNVDIDNELSTLQSEDYAASVNNFEARLKAEFDLLDDAAERIQATAQALYNRESRVSFGSSNAVAEGGVSLVLAGVGGFVLVFFLCALVVCAVDLPKARKRETPSADSVESAESAKEK